MGNDGEELPISTQLANMQKALSQKIDDGQKLNNAALQIITDKLNSTEAELSLHKAKTESEMHVLQTKITAITARLGINPSLNNSGGYAGRQEQHLLRRQQAHQQVWRQNLGPTGTLGNTPEFR